MAAGRKRWALQVSLSALLLLMTVAPVSAPSLTILIHVDGVSHYQTISGFGATLTPFERDGVYRAHDPSQPQEVTATLADRQAIAEILYSKIGLSRTRVFPDGFEPVNDNNDPFTMNLTAYDWMGVNPLTDFVALARPYGLQTWWASFAMDAGPEQAWLRRPNSCKLDPTKIDEEVEWLLAAALRFRDRGVELPYMAVNNEPDLCGSGFKIEITDMVTIIKRLGARLRAAGLGTQIVVSDGWIPLNALRYMRAALADPEVSQYVGALAYHAYDGYGDPASVLNTSAVGNPPHAAVEDRQQIRDLAAQYNLPVWMTEVCYCTPRQFSEFELLRARLNHLHDELTIANVAAFDAMNLFFIERPGVWDELVHVSFRPDGTLERYAISIYGYLLGHYSRYVAPGSVRLRVDSNDPRVRVTAFERPDGKLVIVALNNNTSSVESEITFSGLRQIPAALSVLTSREGAIWQNQTDVSAGSAGVSTLLPPLSVTTFVGR